MNVVKDDEDVGDLHPKKITLDEDDDDLLKMKRRISGVGLKHIHTSNIRIS